LAGKLGRSHSQIDEVSGILNRENGFRNIDCIHRSEQPSLLSFLTPEDLRRADESDDFKFDANVLDLYPDPLRFVRFLKAIDRADISSDLFVKLLDMYHKHKSQAGSDPTQFVLLIIPSLAFTYPIQDATLPSNNYADANPVVGWKNIVKYTLQTCAFIILY
jgi:hypothetical protein